MLLQLVNNGSLLGYSSPSEGNRAAEQSSSCAIANTHNTNVIDSSDGGITGHFSRHPDLHIEPCSSSKVDILDA